MLFDQLIVPDFPSVPYLFSMLFMNYFSDIYDLKRCINEPLDIKIL